MDLSVLHFRPSLKRRPCWKTWVAIISGVKIWKFFKWKGYFRDKNFVFITYFYSNVQIFRGSHALCLVLLGPLTFLGESEHMHDLVRSTTFLFYWSPRRLMEWNIYTFPFFSSLQWPNLPRNELHLSCKKWTRRRKWKSPSSRDCLNKGSAHFYLSFHLESNIILSISNCALFRFLVEKIEGYNWNELIIKTFGVVSLTTTFFTALSLSIFYCNFFPSPPYYIFYFIF